MEVGEDGDLSSVQWAAADALVLLYVCEGLLPLAGAGQGASAVGEHDRPQPLAERAVVFLRAGEVAEGDGAAVDHGVAVSADRVDEGLE
ncbi:hypothetical protein ACFQHO_09555 [Actinomadura yumaensis]|uniref:hypothetical protein n=1 Tax=Actinomadura yumaensis TaxID=111807 RepID=UPI00360E1BA3